jgi:RNA polymerase sigma factor (sigma-70 family)
VTPEPHEEAEILAAREPMRRLARLLRPDAADDVTQEALLIALRDPGAFRGQGSRRSWLFGIVRNVARSHGRSSRRAVSTEPSLLDLGISAGWGQHVAPPDDEKLAIRDAYAELEDDEREVLWLRDVEGLSGEETADALGVSLPAMKSRLHRARLRLLGAFRGGES